MLARDVAVGSKVEEGHGPLLVFDGGHYEGVSRVDSTVAEFGDSDQFCGLSLQSEGLVLVLMILAIFEV